MDGDPESFLVKIQYFGDKFPSPRDRLVFEIVSKAEVAHHLEESEVTVSFSNVV